MKFLKVSFSISLGIALQNLYITSPIHELGHIIFLALIGERGVYSWRTTTYYTTLSGFSDILMGWSGIFTEFSVFLFLAVIFAKYKKVFLLWTCFGVSLSAYFTAASYTDVIKRGNYGVHAWYPLAGIALVYAVTVINKRSRAKSSIPEQKTRYSSPVVR